MEILKGIRLLSNAKQNKSKGGKKLLYKSTKKNKPYVNITTPRHSATTVAFSHLRKSPTFKKRTDFSPTCDSALTGVLTQRCFHEEDWNTTGEQK